MVSLLAKYYFQTCGVANDFLSACLGINIQFISSLFVFFIYLKNSIQLEGEKIRFPNGCNDLGWTRLKAGLWNSILLSHMGCRGQSTSAAFQAQEQGVESDGEQLGLELMPIQDAAGGLSLSANVWFLLSFKEQKQDTLSLGL